MRDGRGVRQAKIAAGIAEDLEGLEKLITRISRERDLNERRRVQFSSKLQALEQAIARKGGVPDTQDQMRQEHLIGVLRIAATVSRDYSSRLQSLALRREGLSTHLADLKRELEESMNLYPSPHQQQTMAGISPSAGDLLPPAGEVQRSRRMEHGRDNMPYPPAPGQPYSIQPGGLPAYADASYMPSNVYHTTTNRPQSHLEYPEPYGQNTPPYRWVTSQHGGDPGIQRVVYEPSWPPTHNHNHGQPPGVFSKEIEEQIAQLFEALKEAGSDRAPPRNNNHGQPPRATAKERVERRVRFLERSNSDQESRTTGGPSQIILGDGTRISVGETVRVVGPDGRTQTFANEGDPSGMHIDISEDGSVTVRSPKPGPDQGRPRESSKRVSFAVDKATGSTLMPPAKVQHRHSSHGLSSQYGQHPQSASPREPVSLSIRPSMHRSSVLDLARQSEPNLNNDNTVRARRGADPLSINMPPLSAMDFAPPRPGFSNGLASPAISESSTTSGEQPRDLQDSQQIQTKLTAVAPAGQSVAMALDLRGRSLPRSQFYHFQDGSDKESEKFELPLPNTLNNVMTDDPGQAQHGVALQGPPLQAGDDEQHPEKATKDRRRPRPNHHHRHRDRWRPSIPCWYQGPPDRPCPEVQVEYVVRASASVQGLRGHERRSLFDGARRL